MMSQYYIQQSELAHLMNCTERTVRRKITCGEIEAIRSINNKNRDKYLIPLSSLSEELQAKYYREFAPERVENVDRIEIVAEEKPIMKHKRNIPYKGFEDMTDAQRTEYRFWIDTLDAWHTFREEFDGSKEDADAAFVASMKCAPYHVTRGILYKRNEIVRIENYNPYLLVEQRGRANYGRSSVPQPLMDWYLSQWLDQRRLSHAVIYKALPAYAKKHCPEHLDTIPGIDAFKRYIMRNVPEALVTRARYGEKAFIDRHQPYIVRDYESLETNDVWIADTHTLDVISAKDEGGQNTHRLYITAILDARSSVIVGWDIDYSPNSQSVLYALRKGILRCGIPSIFYVDNGSEYLCYDVGGRGHRRRKSQEGQLEPPPVLARLGIKMVNANVENAKAKVIERTFRTFHEQVSKLFHTFCGGNPTERPEQLKYLLKKGDVISDSELKDKLNTLIDGYYNIDLYGGAVKRDHSKRRIDVYNEHLISKRTAPEADLNLMLMRTSRPQKIGRNGVYLSIAGEKLFYWQEDVCNYQGQLVYVRFDPDDLDSVRLYEAETDRFIACWPLARETRIKFIDDHDTVANAIRLVNTPKKLAKKQVAAYHKAVAKGKDEDILDIIYGEAKSNLDQIVFKSPKRIEPIFSGETAVLPRAVGEVEEIEVSLSRMARNAAKNKALGGFFNE